MPNHVTNILTIDGPLKRVKEIYNAISPVDPELAKKPIPKRKAGHVFTPASEIEVAHRRGNTYEIDFNKIILMPKGYDQGDKWYDWSLSNWGTKWNAYSQEKIDDRTMQFDTAWAFPEPVMIALSEKFPDVTIKVRFADEDLGNNCGEVHYRGGDLVFSDYPEGGSKDAYELAFDVKGYGREDYKYDEEKGTYVYHDRDEDTDLIHNESVKCVGGMAVDLKKVFEGKPVFKAAGPADVRKRQDPERKEWEEKMQDPAFGFMWGMFFCDHEYDAEQWEPFENWDRDSLIEKVESSAEDLKAFMKNPKAWSLGANNG